MYGHKLFGLVLAGLLLIGGLYLLAWLALPEEKKGAGKTGEHPIPPPTDGVDPGAPGGGPRPLLGPERLAHLRSATVFVQYEGVSHLDDSPVARGSGTGFFIGADGRILTNWHVVDHRAEPFGQSLPLRTAELQVILHSGTSEQEALPARVIAADPRRDLALLKIAKDACPVIELGDADRLHPTVPVWSCGFPFGELFTVLQRGPALSINRGLITSLRRDVRGVLQRIQFDAAVNHGNSGGPLLLDDGRAYGVANIALGTTRVNFAVPSGHVQRLLERCPPDARLGDACRLRVDAAPAATVWLDGERLGTTPLAATVAGGYRRLVLTAPGRRSVGRWLAIHDGLAVEDRLPPLRTVILDPRPPAAVQEGAAATALPHGEGFFAEDFTDLVAADWRQDTGSDDETRTWYVQDGELRQFAPDGLLHAIFHDAEDWQNYAFAARVRIADNPKDGRAGLIFRADPDGFLLFRLHRRSRQVQLVHHGKRPFGWRFLARRTLPEPVAADRWYRLEVQAAGREIRCLLDGEVVLSATAAAEVAGGIGFYAVDAEAAFDDAQAWHLEEPQRADGRPLSLYRYWFNDHFQEDYGCWRSLVDFAPGPPWRQIPGGCLQSASDPVTRLRVLDAFDLHLGSATCLLTAADGASGLAFRVVDDRGYAVRVLPAERRAELIYFSRDADSEVLATGRLPPSERLHEAALRHHLHSIKLEMAGPILRAVVDGQVALEAHDDRLTHGRLALYSRGGRALFLNVTGGYGQEDE